MCSMVTYQFRIKDATTGKQLLKLAGTVNYLWNYCNATSSKAIKCDQRWLSAYDLQLLTAGTSKELGIHSRTVQLVCAEYVTRREQFKKAKLHWRSAKRCLGWIPFDASGIKIKGDKAIYLGHQFRMWLSRPVEGKIKTGSFSQDARGHWYINLQCQVESWAGAGNEEIGIDLGLKTKLALSNGAKYDRENLTKKYEEKLARAQRAGHKKQAKKIHAQIANSRKDWNHKKTTEIAKIAKSIYVGNVSSGKLVKSNLAKSVADASWRQIKDLLKYKVVRLGGTFAEVNEAFSTVTCSACFARTGPSGLSALGVRQWICSACGTEHDRDINSSINILLVGLGHQTPIKGILQL
jgi:putative transposase